MSPLLRLPQFDRTLSMVTFLTKFQHMASYLHWNDEDTFHDLCVSLEGDTGQVLWVISPRAMTANIVHLLQTRFGTQLEAESFKAELQARWKAPGESLQQLYQDICRLVNLAYPSSKASLVTHVVKEAFIAALSNSNLQVEVMKQEPQTVEEHLVTPLN